MSGEQDFCTIEQTNEWPFAWEVRYWTGPDAPHRYVTPRCITKRGARRVARKYLDKVRPPQPGPEVIR